MTHTPEFLACYSKAYGRYDWIPPDYLKCARGVHTSIWGGHKQCTRKNGHGPHGAYCKQHDPDAVKARSDAQQDKWRAKWDHEARTDLQAERDAWKARAEAAEAKLADAVKALELADRNLTSLQPKIANGLVQDSWVPVFDAYIDPVIESSRAILAKLKGNNNDRL